MTLTARKFSEGHMPYCYYNLKHRHSIFIFFIIMFLSFKSYCYNSDRKKFPDLHKRPTSDGNKKTPKDAIASQ